MKNEELHYYISHFGDFSPVIMYIEKEPVESEFVFMSSEKSIDITETELKEENFYF